MKHILSLFIAITFSLPLYAQISAPTAVPGCRLWLDAQDLATFSPGNVGTSTPAIWLDKSGLGNNVESLPGINYYGIAPYTSGIPDRQTGTGMYNLPFYGIYFDGNDFMETPGIINNPTAPPPPGGHPTQPIGPAANGFTNNEATLFVVRIANTSANSGPAPGYFKHDNAMLSIHDQATTSWNNEFLLTRDLAVHHTVSGSFSHKTQQCFPQLPSDRPVVLATVLGSATTDVDYYVNGVLSTLGLTTFGIPMPYTADPRRIIVGARRNLIQGLWMHRSEHFEGHILEVVAYDRKLTPVEINDVTEYLQCKYSINYVACNNPSPNCIVKCFLSPTLAVNHLGTAPNGNDCMFQGTVTANPRPGYTIMGYEWSIPGQTPVWFPTSAATHTYPFTLVAPIFGNVTVRVLAVNNSAAFGDPPCCDYSMSEHFWCDNGGYWGNKPGATTIPAATKAKQVRIYPNPSTGLFTIEMQQAGDYSIRVLNIIGSVVYEGKINNGQKKIIQLDGQLPQGSYMIHVSGNDTRHVEKIVIVN